MPVYELTLPDGSKKYAVAEENVPARHVWLAFRYKDVVAWGKQYDPGSLPIVAFSDQRKALDHAIKHGTGIHMVRLK